MIPTLLTGAGSGLQTIPEGVSDAISSGLGIVTDTVGEVSTMITSNWILWLSLAFGILGFSISIFRRLRKRK